jgi:hypothetical protein
MSLLARAEPVAKWKGAQGEVEVLRLSPTVVYLRMEGIAEQPSGPTVERALLSLFRGSHGLHTFWDLRDLINYHSDLRVCSTNALLANRTDLLSLHTLSTSKIVAMGVAVANLALGGIITSHKSAMSFESAVREALSNAQHPHG